MTGLPHGLYEQLVTEGLEEALSALDSKHRAHRADLHPEEAADRIAFHLAALVRRSVAALDTGQRTEIGARLAREVTRLGCWPRRASANLWGLPFVSSVAILGTECP